MDSVGFREHVRMRTRRLRHMRTLSVLTLIAGAMMLTGCDIELGDFGNSDRFQKDFRYSYPLKPGGTFSLETMNGSVDIAGWDRDEVEITGTQYAKTEALRDAIRIDVTHSDSAASVRTVAPFDTHGGVGARYVVRVPRKVTLEHVTSSNGKIHVSDIDGAAKLRTSNGSIQVAKVMGNVEAQSSNGAVEANQVTGAAHLHTTNGHIEAEAVKGAVDATSSNGSITLTMSDGLNGEVRASTSNSSINVKLPSSAAARVRASTSNSNIQSDFPLGNGGTEEKRHMEGSINGGAGNSPLLDLTTSNGGIHITKL